LGCPQNNGTINNVGTPPPDPPSLTIYFGAAGNLNPFRNSDYMTVWAHNGPALIKAFTTALSQDTIDAGTPFNPFQCNPGFGPNNGFCGVGGSGGADSVKHFLDYNMCTQPGIKCTGPGAKMPFGLLGAPGTPSWLMFGVGGDGSASLMRGHLETSDRPFIAP